MLSGSASMNYTPWVFLSQRARQRPRPLFCADVSSGPALQASVLVLLPGSRNCARRCKQQPTTHYAITTFLNAKRHACLSSAALAAWRGCSAAGKLAVSVSGSHNYALWCSRFRQQQITKQKGKKKQITINIICARRRMSLGRPWPIVSSGPASQASAHNAAASCTALGIAANKPTPLWPYMSS